MLANRQIEPSHDMRAAIKLESFYIRLVCICRSPSCAAAAVHTAQSMSHADSTQQSAICTAAANIAHIGRLISVVAFIESTFLTILFNCTLSQFESLVLHLELKSFSHLAVPDLEGDRAGSAPLPLGDGLTPSLTFMLADAK